MSIAFSSTIAFLGCGSMNEAILSGLLGGGLDPSLVRATVRRPERAARLRERYGITVYANEENSRANPDAAKDAGVLILGVKPAGTVALAREIADGLDPHTLVISVAAGVSLELLEGALPAGQPVIRSMPNTPVRVGRGVVSVSAGTSCTPELLELARQLLTPAGMVVEIPESQVDALTAVSGSGPAYAYYLAEAMAAAGARLGLDAELAATLARETVAGAGALLGEPGADATALRIAVSSQNGTTARAIATFDEQGLPAVIAAGMQACRDRAAEITRELKAQE